MKRRFQVDHLTPSSKSAVLLEQGDHISDSLGVGFAGLELVAELHEIALSLALSSDSRAFSLSICEISLSSRCIRFFRSIDLILRSTTGRQLSVDSQRRQRGKEERNSDLLVEGDSGAPEQVDMAVARKERDQGRERTGQKSDPALQIKSKQHRSQPALHPRYRTPVLI